MWGVGVFETAAVFFCSTPAEKHRPHTIFGRNAGLDGTSVGSGVPLRVVPSILSIVRRTPAHRGHFSSWPSLQGTLSSYAHCITVLHYLTRIGVVACLFKVRNVYVNERHNLFVQRWMRADDAARGVPVRARVALTIASRRRSPRHLSCFFA